MKKACLLLIWLIGCTTAYPTRQIQSDQACPVLTAAQLKFSKIVSLVHNSNCNIRTISDLLEKLPKDFMSHYSLFYRSRSLQGPNEVDYLNPRALIFQDNLVISFNNNFSQAGHNSLEAVVINPDAKNVADMFQYSEINFPYHESEVGHRSWESVQAEITVSSPNSVRCMACHGNPARPIFPGYPTWDGAYGSQKGEHPVREEVAAYWQYRHQADTQLSSRYKNLPPMPTKPEIPGFARSPEEYPVVGLADANERLNGLLGHINGMRVGRLILKTPNYTKFRYALAGAMLACDSWPSFIPKPLRSELMNNIEQRFALSAKWPPSRIDQFVHEIYDHEPQFQLITDVEFFDPGSQTSPKRPFPDFENQIAIHASHDSDFERLLLDTFQVQGITRADRFGAHLRLIMQGQGLEIDQWFLDLTQPTYRFQDGEAPTFAALRSILKYDGSFDNHLRQEILPATDPENYTPSMNIGAKLPQICDDLRIASLKELKTLHVAPLPPKPELSPSAYPITFSKTCSQCHSGAVGCSVDIPFEDPIKMAQWLRQGDHLNKIKTRVFSADETYKMPPTSFLTEAELNNIREYLSGL